MFQVIKQWFKRHFSDPEAVILLFSLAFLFALLQLFGRVLAPLIASIVIAYLLDGLIGRMERCKIPHKLSVIVVFLLFIGVVISIFGLLPMLWQQLQSLMEEIPQMIGHGQKFLTELQTKYPDLLTHAQMGSLLATAKLELGNLGQFAVTKSLAVLPGMVRIIVYIVLVPLLVFFLLIDKKTILAWFGSFMPQNNRLVRQVWHEMHISIGKYVRGRIVEIFIVSMVTAATFSLMGLQYALLLGALVGLSVIVPYIGAVVVTVPVIAIAFFQWGLSAQLVYLLIAYAVIILLDANVLVPLLFAEAVSLHPVVIILSVLIFGAIWGFWGIFFAIPLAALVKAVLTAWPSLPKTTE